MDDKIFHRDNFLLFRGILHENIPDEIEHELLFMSRHEPQEVDVTYNNTFEADEPKQMARKVKQYKPYQSTHLTVAETR